MPLRKGVYTVKLWVKGVQHDMTVKPEREELSTLSGATGRQDCNVSPRLHPLRAPSHVVSAAKASHAGTAAETAAHHADEEDETAVEGAKAVPVPLPSQPTARELEAHREAHTHRTELGARHACEDEGATQITSGWRLNTMT